MPGLLTTIFEGSDDGGNGQESQSYHAGGDGDVAIDPSITISNHMSGSYESADGSTTSWERTDSATVEADVSLHATIDSAVTTEDAIFE